MARVSSKKDKNIYQQTRENLDLSREGASELLEWISPERIERIENEKSWPNPDEVLQMAEKYSLPRKQQQIIQPYEYGHASKKSTCLWLKGLPLLTPTEIVEPDLVQYTCKSGKKVTFSRHMVQGFENGERAKSRSKTFEGVAKAMAEQWG